MIEDLSRRYRAQQQAVEQGTTELAAPINRQVNVSFAPGSATSIINTVKGYPTAVSFFDSTGQPWPIQWDTNPIRRQSPAARTAMRRPTPAVPSVAAIGFYVCTPTKGSNVLEITPVSISPRGGLVVSLEGAPEAAHLPAGVGRRPLRLRASASMSPIAGRTPRSRS